MFNKKNNQELKSETKELIDPMDKLDLYKTVLIRGFVTKYHENLSNVEIHFGKVSYNPYLKHMEFEKDDLKNILEDVRDFEKENVFMKIYDDAIKAYDYKIIIRQLDVFLHVEYQNALSNARNIWGWSEVDQMLEKENDMLMKFIINKIRELVLRK